MNNIPGHRRHKFIYKTFRILLKPVFKYFLKFTPQQQTPEISGTYLVIANHCTDFDPILLGICFPEHMYFVASEHVMSKRVLSWLLNFACYPVLRLKGTTAAATVREICRRVKNGASICMFAEGSRTYNGQTAALMPATGKLIKLLKIPVVTYRFEGGYFTSPRWGNQIRRGGMTGNIVNIYPADQLSKLDATAIEELIAADICEDAYSRQLLNMYSYNGPRPAEHLEYLLFICPRCRQTDTLISSNNQLTCSCGLQVTYLKTGFLQDSPFPTLTEWDHWQRACLQDLAQESSASPFFTNADAKLQQIGTQHRRQLITQGTLALYHDRLVCGITTFKLEEIPDIAIVSKATLVFTHQNKNYELSSSHIYSMYKYYIMFHLLKER